jgi:plasmid stabilization system protein ParE
MILSTHPLAADELVDGAVFYARQGTVELAEDFVAEFERSVGLLQSHPELGAVWRGKFRRLPLRRFPYSIVYFLSGDLLRIVALAHQRRRPGYWRSRA